VAPASSPTKPAVRHAYGPQGRSLWMDVDWRAHQRWTIINDSPVNVIELDPKPAHADHPALVFVHGLSGSWPNWLEQLPVFAGLAGGNGYPAEPVAYRVIALDLPGFGRSPMPTEPISISGYARTLDALLDQLGVGAAAVVGNSMGGFVAAELAINFPQRVERLVLVSAAGLSTYNDPRGLRALARIRRGERSIAAYAGWVAAHSDTVARRPRLRNATLGLVARHPSRLPAPLAAEQLRGAGKPGFIEALQASLEYDFHHRLGEIVCPTLIVWGDRDRVITVRDAERFAELIPGARKVVYEDTGHVAMLERPAEFNALLAEFLGE
jgi:pimeloyl-ACP methyl ester carboxylesterase